MSDTPRTDEREARSEGLHDEWAFTLCRQLERELNDARDTKWAREIHSCHNACARPICTLRRERDEAMERLAHAEILLSDLASDYWRAILNDQDPSREGLMGERVAQYWAREIHSCHNACARPICTLRRERDEWKEKAERLQTACNKWSESEMPLTNCPDCKQFRGHGHQCKSEPPPARNCRECCGQGQVEIQSGPYMTQCPECNGTGKQTNQPKP